MYINVLLSTQWKDHVYQMKLKTNKSSAERALFPLSNSASLAAVCNVMAYVSLLD